MFWLRNKENSFPIYMHSYLEAWPPEISFLITTGLDKQKKLA